MKKTKKHVKTEVKEVERLKCDDCGYVGDESEMFTLALNPVLMQKSMSFWHEREWGEVIRSTYQYFKIETESEIHVCESCKKEYEETVANKTKCPIDRELERDAE